MYNKFAFNIKQLTYTVPVLYDGTKFYYSAIGDNWKQSLVAEFHGMICQINNFDL